jgi:hypothetical protein
MSGKKEKAKRTCGHCHQSGHNIRSCPQKKAAEAAGGASPVMSTALALAEPPVTASADAASGLGHQPIEFEELVKQVYVNGTMVRLSVREFETGVASMTLRFQREGQTPKEAQFDQDVAVKLYELLAWALQRRAVRSADVKALPQRSQPNGAQPKPAATT